MSVSADHHHRRASPALGFALFAAAWVVQSAEYPIFRDTVHLGVAGFPEWEEFANSRPHGRNLELQFEATRNAKPRALLLTQEGVKHGWQVLVNGKSLGRLPGSETRLTARFTVPAGGLRDGRNRLDIRAPKQVDDVRVENIRLLDKSFEQSIADTFLNLRVTDATDGNPLPCRLTVVGPDGALAALTASGLPADAPVAVRPGVVYTRNGRARLRLLPGEYTIYASRGFEYSVATNRVRLASMRSQSLRLQIAREVPTPGLVAVDTHIHTRTLSGHGDSTLDERMLTIAGEGIEVAVATEHNHHGDYDTPSRRLKTHDFFTAVTGNEVTTRHGHFNAFPIRPQAVIPDYKATDWTSLLSNIRATPDVQVIQLNHPHNLHSGFSPFSSTNLNPVSGRPAATLDFGFDAMEVLTSAAMQSDIMLLFRDWFALLNHGHRIVGLASSDTHDVNRFILGQGRTYVWADDRHPGSVDVTSLCRSMRKGRCLISFGLLTHMHVNGNAPGELTATRDGRSDVQVRVLGPSWMQADRLQLFANGEVIAERQIRPTTNVTKAELNFEIGSLPNDTFLVAVATGPGITAPFWDTPRPYQPTSKRFQARMLGATNPIFIDADGDGRFTSAGAYAERLLKENTNIATILSKLSEFDQAVAIQTADRLLQAKRATVNELKQHLQDSPPAIQRAVSNYLDTLTRNDSRW